MHGDDPRTFLEETHRFPELGRMVRFHPAVRHALARLGGRQIVFSNAPRSYVNSVLRHCGLDRSFDAVYSIEDSGYLGKPSVRSFQVLLRNHDLDPHRCALVDDVLSNVLAAKRLGLSTVWVTRQTRHAPGVDLRVPSILDLPRLAFRHAA
jgi:putative hydrolase of the HAD superfamily